MVNYSVTNYNPCNNQNIGYNSPTCKITEYGRVPSFTSQPDTVELSTQKEGLSNDTKWGIGIGIVTILVIGADYIFCKGKHVKNLWCKLRGNNSKTNEIPTMPSTSSHSVPSKKPKFFEEKGLKVNKDVVLNAEGTLYTGTLEKVNKSGEKFVLEYKKGILQTSKKYSNTGDYISCKKYTQEIETGYDNNRVPYPIKKRYMFEYNKDNKIVNGTLVYEGKNCTYYNNSKYSMYKNDNEIIKTRYATKDGTKEVLFEKPLEKESDAKFLLGCAGMKALQSPLKTHYSISK